MTFTKRDLEHILSKNRYVIKKGKANLDKLRKKKTKSNIPQGKFGRIVILTEKDVIDDKKS